MCPAYETEERSGPDCGLGLPESWLRKHTALWLVLKATLAWDLQIEAIRACAQTTDAFTEVSWSIGALMTSNACCIATVQELDWSSYILCVASC